MQDPAQEFIFENDVPRSFNAASYFIDRHLEQGRGEKAAFVDFSGEHTYQELADRVNKVANALRGLGLRQEARIALIMTDSFDFPAVFWGAVKAGVVPVAINTLLTTEHYRYILRDCRPQVLFVSASLHDTVVAAASDTPSLDRVIVTPDTTPDVKDLERLLLGQAANCTATETTRDDTAFWLYSSGSTGNPKGVLHRHANPYWTAKCFGRGVLGIEETDVVFSASKLFFAYGLGASMSFPLEAGATTILLRERPTPETVTSVLRKYQPTIFFSIPTLYAAILDNPGCDPKQCGGRLRRCVSAGEALPAATGRHFEERFGIEILDGVGSTELLQTFLSNRPGDVHYGCSGLPVPGYELRLVDDHFEDLADGEIGELMVKAPSMCNGYFNQREKNQRTFLGPWILTGDKYYKNGDGYYVYCGRSDDMFKSGGNWVSPVEVESQLASHERVQEAAVVSHTDNRGNEKPYAFVVLKPGGIGSEELAEELKIFVKTRLERWKYPRWIHFIDELPRTATGKTQRFRLRGKTVARSPLNV